MGTPEERSRPVDTREFLALWSAAKEEHFAHELAPMLPVLLGSPDNLDPNRTQEAARHLVRALHIAFTTDGGLHGALDYLTRVVATLGEPSGST